MEKLNTAVTLSRAEQGRLITEDLPANLFWLVLGLIAHEVTWPAPATWVPVVLAVVIVMVTVAVASMVRRRHARRSRVDAAAQHMAKGRDLRARLPAQSCWTHRRGLRRRGGEGLFYVGSHSK
jgi:hypothetical protein